jgi:ribosomal protein L7/L12
MSRTLLLIVIVDVAVMVLLAVWVLRRRMTREDDLRRRIGALESGRGLSTADVLQQARAAGGLGGAAVAGSAEAAALAAIRQVRAPAPGDEAAAGEIVRAVRDGQLIPAIKRYREVTGLGLKEAKEAIDRLQTVIDR